MKSMWKNSHKALSIGLVHNNYQLSTTNTIMIITIVMFEIEGDKGVFMIKVF